MASMNSPLAVGVLAALVLSVTSAAGQSCPAGMPASPWPGPAFVPTANCRGWVPATHPDAGQTTPRPTGILPPFALIEQDIYTGLEGLPASISAFGGHGLRSLRGWAVDCAMGRQPPVLKIVETKPDGTVRDIPITDDAWSPTQSRADIQAAFGAACPAVFSPRAVEGRPAGPDDRFGWFLQLDAPITEMGVHTFTVIWSWPSLQHSGSSSLSVRIVP